MAKVLIAISSCESYERLGLNRAVRDTWLKDAAVSNPEVDVRFFMGGTWLADGDVDVCGNMHPRFVNTGLMDVVMVDCEDHYGALTYKTRASLRWAAERGYDFVFRCFPDTYVRVDRLMACGFEGHDYHGDFRGEVAGWQNYASGGAGYFLSRRAYLQLLDEPVTGVWKDNITPYAEDLWVGNRLGKDGLEGNGLVYFDDTERFINRGQTCWPDAGNPYVTSHLSCGAPNEKYRKEMMHDCHRHWKRSLR